MKQITYILEHLKSNWDTLLIAALIVALATTATYWWKRHRIPPWHKIAFVQNHSTGMYTVSAVSSDGTTSSQLLQLNNLWPTEFSATISVKCNEWNSLAITWWIEPDQNPAK